MRTENWCGYDIRFVEINGEWWAILKDICDALKLRTAAIAQRLHPEMLERVLVEAPDTFKVISNDVESDMGLNMDRSNIPSRDVRSKIGSNDVESDHLSRVDRSKVISNDVECRHLPVKDVTPVTIGRDIGRRPGEWKTHWMLAVNELGIYEALFASRRLEARKFRMWAGTVMQKLRAHVGLQGYEVMRMTEKDIQDEIDDLLDTLFYDEETNTIMRSVTVQGGDVEQVVFE